MSSIVESGATSLTEQLRLFRASHALRRVTVNGTQWEYISCGVGERCLLLLPGAPGRGETAFQQIMALEGEYRIVAPNFPPQLSTLDEMLSGLAGIMEAEGIEQACVVGGSYSGLIAQSFVRRYPERVSGLVLADTGIPRKSRARKYMWYLRLLKVLPTAAIRALWRLGARLYLREIVEEKAFWRAYFGELTGQITRQECVGRLTIWIEFDRSRFTAHDLDGWTGEILILEAEGDKTFPPAERAVLRKLYPKASAVTFPGGNHASVLSRKSEYITEMQRFLRMYANAA